MKAKIPTSPVPFIFHIMGKHKWLLYLIFLLVFLTELFFAVGPLLLGRIIDGANILTQEGVGTLSAIGLLVLVYVFIQLLVAVSISATSFVMHYLAKHVRTNAYRVLFEYLSLHSTTYFGSRFAGSISSDVNIAGRNTVRMIGFFSRSFLGMIFGVIVSFFIIATASMTIALLFVGGVILLIPINYFLAKPAIHLAKKSVETVTTLRGRIVDAITNITAVQQFTHHKNELNRINVSIKNYQEASIKSDFYREKVLLFNNVVIILLFIGGLMYGTFTLWMNEVITLGEFIMVMTLSGAFIQSLSHIGNTINDFASIYGETKHALEEILREHDVIDGPHARELRVMKGELVFQNISFDYDGTSEVFRDFTLKIKGGERVGIVGPSGGGKTTLMKLLLRQYDVNTGSISIDGQNIRDVKQDSLRRSIGIVPQEPALFHRSLHENIAYGKSGSTTQEVEEAAQKAQIHDFIVKLKQGYKTITGERGIKLSGGQRQRVAIARTILKAAPILVLDEATSALDSESEVAIQKGLHELMRGKTVIAIAHRLSTIKEMDRIIVIADGRIVQDASHKELLKDTQGMYARLWNHQAGGFLKDDEEE